MVNYFFKKKHKHAMVADIMVVVIVVEMPMLAASATRR